jgi:AbrB family looped-hinge helix DNA binding protein
MMETSVITSKGQVLIPKRLRNKYGIKSGIKVAFIETKEGLMLKAMDEAYFDHFAGLLKDAVPSTAEFKAWKAEDKEKEVEKAETKFVAPAKKKE